MKRLWRALFPKADREWCYVMDLVDIVHALRQVLCVKG